MTDHLYEERVRFGDLDAMRHLNNVEFLRFFETARIDFIRQVLPQHDPAQPEASTFGFIVAEMSIVYRSPVHFDEVVGTRCTIAEVRRSAVKIDFTMHVGEREAAHGFAWLVGFDYTTQAASRFPDTIRAAFERNAGPDGRVPSASVRPGGETRGHQ